MGAEGLEPPWVINRQIYSLLSSPLELDSQTTKQMAGIEPAISTLARWRIAALLHLQTKPPSAPRGTRTLTPCGTGFSNRRVYRSTKGAIQRRARESNPQSREAHSLSRRAHRADLCRLSKQVEYAGFEPAISCFRSRHLEPD